MFDWLRRRAAKRAKVALQEKKMEEALRKLDDEHSAAKQVNGGEVDQIEKQVAEAADETVALLEAELAELNHGTG